MLSITVKDEYKIMKTPINMNDKTLSRMTTYTQKRFTVVLPILYSIFFPVDETGTTNNFPLYLRYPTEREKKDTKSLGAPKHPASRSLNVNKPRIFCIR